MSLAAMLVVVIPCADLFSAESSEACLLVLSFVVLVLFAFVCAGLVIGCFFVRVRP